MRTENERLIELNQELNENYDKVSLLALCLLKYSTYTGGLFAKPTIGPISYSIASAKSAQSNTLTSVLQMLQCLDCEFTLSQISPFLYVYF